MRPSAGIYNSLPLLLIVTKVLLLWWLWTWSKLTPSA